ncbi:MAG TPA: urea ABC transporter permease subunit UrtC [Polyangiaceae bacterium]|nr:urea ABC transporter permease subunit UrtC [Polyangiaceae bacterium]
MSALVERLREMHSPRTWLVLGIVFLALVAGVPFSGAPDYVVTLLGKFACYGMVAVAMDLIWGYAGILSLGHGVFFALGGYAMGMYLLLSIGEQGVYRSKLPDFMVFLDWKELPWFWRGMDDFGLALVVALVVPGLLAWVFGWFAFRSRIKGVYFSIITQALTFALMLLFFRNDTGFGGNNGLTNFKQIYGYPLADPSTKAGLYVFSVVFLFASYLLCRFLVTSRLGRILRAIRDAEGRLMFSGYDPKRYKLFVWVLSAVLCGVAGALYVPQVGIINPSEMQPSNSVEMAIWVAVGGRSTLLGAAVGALLVNAGKSWFTVAVPEAWLYVLGAIFIVVTLFLPRGVVGTLDRKGSLST